MVVDSEMRIKGRYGGENVFGVRVCVSIQGWYGGTVLMGCM